MTWLELNDLVFTLLSYQGEREKHEAYLKQQIRFAALDLQRYIPAYREGHTTQVFEADIETDGASGSFALPEGALLKRVWLSKARTYKELLTGESHLIPTEEGQPSTVTLVVKVWLSGTAGDTITLSFDEEAGDEQDTYVIQKTDVWEEATFDIETTASGDRDNLNLRGDGDSLKVAEATVSGTYDAFYDVGATACEREASRIVAKFHPWERRNELICGNVNVNTQAAYAYERRTRQLVVWPAPVNPDGGYVIYEWDGKKLSFADGDTVPFDEMCVQPIFNYVRSRMLTDIDGDRTEGWKLMQTYERERTQLYAEACK